MRPVTPRPRASTFAGSYKGRWTPEEHERLAGMVASQGRVWTAIGQELGRIPQACADRWRTHGHKGEGHVPHNIGSWKPEEVEALRKAVHEVHGDEPPRKFMKWQQISQIVKCRSWDQCRTCVSAHPQSPRLHWIARCAVKASRMLASGGGKPSHASFAPTRLTRGGIQQILRAQAAQDDGGAEELDQRNGH